MAQVRFFTGNDFGNIAQEFDRAVEHFRNGFSGETTNDVQNEKWQPRVDVTELEDNFVLSAELPGIRKEDLSIEFDKGILRISGERLPQEVTEGVKVLRSERLFGKFSRAFKIKTPVKVDAIDAIYKDGMLTLTLPKAEEAKPKAIKIS